MNRISLSALSPAVRTFTHYRRLNPREIGLQKLLQYLQQPPRRDFGTFHQQLHHPQRHPQRQRRPKIRFASSVTLPVTSKGKRTMSSNANANDARVSANINSNGDSIVSNHYGNLNEAESYDSAYFYEPGAYMEHLAELVRNKLQLKQQQQQQHQKRCRCILDIGGGTGTFAHAIIDNDDTGSSVVVVDPFLGPNERKKGIAAAASRATSTRTTPPTVSFVKAPAEDFLLPPKEDSWRSQLRESHHGGYDQILIKEVVHHFHENDRVGIFRGMREGLRSTGGENQNDTTTTIITPSVLIVTRPKVDIDYPLWDAAREVWKVNQPGVDELEKDLRTAGYKVVQHTVEPVECTISLKRWQAMVKSRCWSTFSNFTNSELEDACSIIAEQAKKDPRNYKNRENNDNETILRFEDRLIFLTAA